MCGRSVLGIDVGGTGIKTRLVGADHGHVLDERRVPTPREDSDGRALADVIVRLTRAAEHVSTDRGWALSALGLAVPGVVDDRAGRVAIAVNLGWRDLPLRETVLDALRGAGIDLPLAFGQDVRAGALAEASNHPGTVVFVPVGTGLASALVVDGRVLPGDGWAGEIGQVRITTGKHAGLRIEDIASASAVARRAGASGAREVAERVAAGDPVASAVWDDCVAVLADALAGVTATTGCGTIVVGGGLASSGALLLDPLRAALVERLPGLRVPAVVPAVHGDAAGAIGATMMARAA
jgi:glucokinase